MAGPLVIAPLDQVVDRGAGRDADAAVHGDGQRRVGGAGVDDRSRRDRRSSTSRAACSPPAGTIGGTATITANVSRRDGDDDGDGQARADAERRPGLSRAGARPGRLRRRRWRRPRRRRRSAGQTGVLGGTADGGRDRQDALSVRRHRLAARPARAAHPVEPGDAHTSTRSSCKLHSKQLRLHGHVRQDTTATPFINLPIPADVWHTLTYSNDGKGDDITVTLDVRGHQSGTATAIGPYTMTWHVAPGTLKGTVYYNSYGTALVVEPGQSAVGSCGKLAAQHDSSSTAHAAIERTGPQFGAATLAIKPGATDPVVVAGTLQRRQDAAAASATRSRPTAARSSRSTATTTTISSLYDLDQPARRDAGRRHRHNVWPGARSRRQLVHVDLGRDDRHRRRHDVAGVQRRRRAA